MLRKKIKIKSRKYKHYNPQVAITKPGKIHFQSVENLIGFVVETARPGEMVKVQTRGSLISDDPLFYTYIDQIASIFLKNVLVNQVFQFLVVIHENLSADLYLNDLPIKVLMMTK